MKPLQGLLRRLLPLFCTGLLAACASAPGAPDQPAASTVPAAGGYAVWTVAMNFPGQLALPLDLDIQLEAVGEGGSSTVSSRYDFQINNSLFVAALPAGRYRIKRVGGHILPKEELLHIDGPEDTFEVQTATISFLGQFCFLPADKPGTSPRLGLRQVPGELDALRGALPEGARGWPAAPGWTDAQKVATRRAMYDAAAPDSIGFNNPVALPGGVVYAGARMGQVMARDASGAWRALDTSSSHEIRAVAALPDGRLLVGGDAGYLALSADSGKTWRAAASLPDHGAVVGLGPLSGGGVYAAVASGFDVRFFRSAALESWQEIGSVPMEHGSRGEQHIVAGRVQVYPTAEGFAAYVAIKTIARYQAASNSLSTHVYDDEIQKFQPFGDGSWYAVFSTGRGNEVLRRSEDRGQTWSDLYTLSVFHSSVEAVAPHCLYRIVSEFVSKDAYDPESGRKQVHALYYSANDGKSWQPVSGFGSSSAKYVVLGGDPTKVLAVGNDYIIFGPGIDGKRWRLERPLLKAETPPPAKP